MKSFLKKNPKKEKNLFGEINNKLILGFASVVTGAIVLEAFAFYFTESYGLNNSSLILLSATLAITISLFASIFIAKPISNPIKELYKATQKIEKKNYKTRVKIKTDDELEELGKSFNQMIESLEKADKEHKEIDEAKTRLLSISSHELRSPMTPIKAQLQMLIENYFGDLNEKQKDSLKVILKNTNRLDKIIKDFLDISRIEAARLKFNFEKTSIKKEIEKAIEDVRDYLPEKNIKVKSDIPKIPQIELDTERFEQVLRNLLENAKKFSPENSEIIVKAKEKEKDVLVSVKDFGAGIKKEHIKKLFNSFYQEEGTIYRKYGGVGLGLAICKGIIESQKGKIWVESEKNKGSTFFFTIPKKPLKTSVKIKSVFKEN